MSLATFLLIAFSFFIPNEAIDHIAYVESRNNPRAVSPAGARGLMQVMPATARDPGFGVDPLQNPFDPQESKRFGKEYFSALLKEFGSVRHALMAYNWGPYNVKRWIKNGKPKSWVPYETKRYVKLLEKPVKSAIKRGWEKRFWKSLQKELLKKRYIPKRDGTKCQTETRSQKYRSTQSDLLDAHLARFLLHGLSQPQPIPNPLRRFLGENKQALQKKQFGKIQRSFPAPQESLTAKRI